MRIVIAEDDTVLNQVLVSMLRKWGHDVIETFDGAAALQQVVASDRSQILILDLLLPQIGGIDLCRRLRNIELQPTYILVLTQLDQKDDIVRGLEAGANDYITKPFHIPELQARVNSAARILELQDELSIRIKQLEDSLTHIEHLQSILPICAWCKKVRDEDNYWQQVENYFAEHTQITFTHGVCPACAEKLAVRER